MARQSKNFQQPKRKNSDISFVIDGQCEQWYLQKWIENENLKIKLKPKLSETTAPKIQFDLAVELSKESEKVFWVVDFDAINKETREAKKGQKTALTEFKELYKKHKECYKCKKEYDGCCECNYKNICESYKKIIIVVNNPCLEYWFLLHFEKTSKFFETYEQLQKSLRKYLHDYKKEGIYYKNSRLDIYKRLKDKLPKAIENAKSLDIFDFEEVKSKGFAEMYKIFNEKENDFN